MTIDPTPVPEITTNFHLNYASAGSVAIDTLLLDRQLLLLLPCSHPSEGLHTIGAERSVILSADIGIECAIWRNCIG